MKYGVRFCGGCNPQYDRGKALKIIKEHFPEIDFIHATEDATYDALLVIGGCGSCCASYDQFKTKNDAIKIWAEPHIEEILEKIEEQLTAFKNAN